MFVIGSLYTIFHAEFVSIVIICLHIILHILHANAMLFYSLQKNFKKAEYFSKLY
jgi:hypothetical protein